MSEHQLTKEVDTLWEGRTVFSTGPGLQPGRGGDKAGTHTRPRPRGMGLPCPRLQLGDGGPAGGGPCRGVKDPGLVTRWACVAGWAAVRVCEAQSPPALVGRWKPPRPEGLGSGTRAARQGWDPPRPQPGCVLTWP